MLHSVGDILYGKVNNVKDNGVYVTIKNEKTFGFLPNKKMPSYLDESGQFAGAKYDIVSVVIEDVRPDGMLLLCDFDYWAKKQNLAEFISRYKPGTIFPCEVKSVSDHYATILVSNTIEGHINKEQLGWNAINKVSDVLYVGEPINAVFIGEENGILMFGLKYLQDKPYEDALYDLSLEDLLKFCGHSGTKFIGECRIRGSYVFMENLYSNNAGEKGKILTDKKYGYNLKAIVQGMNTGVINGHFYKFNLALLPKETRLERNQLYQFKAININPILVRLPGHMFVGYYTDKTHKHVNFLETTLIGEVNLDDFFPEEALDSTVVGKSQAEVSRLTFEKSKQYATRKYEESKDKIEAGERNYMFLEISRETRSRVQPIGK